MFRVCVCVCVCIFDFAQEAPVHWNSGGVSVEVLLARATPPPMRPSLLRLAPIRQKGICVDLSGVPVVRRLLVEIKPE